MGVPLSGGYHVFSMDWYPDHVSNWVDGRMYSIVYGNLAQEWTVRTDGTIRVQGRCLDVRESGTWVNALVQIHTCVAGAPSQHWRIESNGAIVNRRADLCLTSAGDEQRLTLQTCTARTTKPAPDKTSGPDEACQLWAVPTAPAVTGPWPSAAAGGRAGPATSSPAPSPTSGPITTP
ncbi:RICIN domain-containing protein [Actinoplanes sp. NEAU-A12]|uniref:RICIN domain-containing protein n=1 Tax=Actinoplanes sandaracinus TaxID=3045177 RepID=A0ABT6WSJ4_9ACTN|nr:RICIN domain-containing protein [Actinoplanes sandaracinus]MDI6102713.1 RICIN domain-containing protein [Actinoplanes sandaracinus]